MAWRPGPEPLGSGSCEYDERDPWTQRFISKTGDGELSLDANAMNGLETAAGAIFVELIRQQAERPNSPADSSISTWMPGYDMGRHYQQHPPAMRMDPPMAQYEPFRRTYVSDPTCIPQLRFANVPDAGADHHKREARCHWRRAGRTWSRVPRFRKGETAFTHDPSYKPPHAVVDKWYRTEAGPKNSLAGRVEESRWQSCHSMQTGRQPRKPTRSRLPWDPKKAGPGPASYHMRDPWEVKEVCGAVPKSRMFCEPVRRPRPQTTAFTLPPAGHQDMSVVTSAASTSACDGPSASGLGESRARPVTVTPEPSASAAVAAGVTAHYTPPCRRKNCAPRKQRSVCGGGGSTGTRHPPTKVSAGGRHRPEHQTTTHASSTARAAARGVRPPTVGPSSFARAERPTITDECRRKEESYGKKVVRLLTREGDVLVTVTRRRASAWGSSSQGPLGLRPDCASASAAATAPKKTKVAAAEPQSAAQQEPNKPNHDGRRAVGRHRSSPGSRNRTAGGGGEGRDAVRDANAAVRAALPAGYAVSPKRGSTLEAQAMRLLPDDLTASLTAYREPGRAELPLVFRATSAPIVRAAPNSRAAKIINRRGAARADTGDVATGPGGGGGDSGTAVATNDMGEWHQEEEARMTRIIRGAEDAVDKSSGGGGDGGGDGGRKTSIRTRLPAPSDPDFASESPGGMDDKEERAQAEGNDGSCGFVSSTVWSGGETSATIVQAGEE